MQFKRQVQRNAKDSTTCLNQFNLYAIPIPAETPARKQHVEFLIPR